MADDKSDKDETETPEEDERESVVRPGPDEPETDDDEGSDEDDSDEDDSDDDDSDEDDSDEDDSDDDDSDDDEGSDEDDSDDDEGSDEDDSADEGSDEEDSDDEGSDDEPAQKKSARAEPKRGKAARRGSTGKTGRRRTKKRGAPESAGARLAAAKAAKAARKAALKAKEKQGSEEPATVGPDPEEVMERAVALGDWVKENRSIVIGVAAILVLALVGGGGFFWYQQSESRAAATALREAIEISNAMIRAEDDEADDDDVSFTSVEDRARAALAAYQRVLTDHGGSDAASWAHLGVARAHAELEDHDEARSAFEAALAGGGTDPQLAWLALEGIGFSFEAQERWDDAINRYEELQGVADGRFEAVGRYHVARMRIAKGQRDQALEGFRTVVDDLRERESRSIDDDAASQPQFRFVLAQAEARLRELDPSAAPARSSAGAPPGGGPPGGGGTGLEGMSPEQIQELIRRMQEGGATP